MDLLPAFGFLFLLVWPEKIEILSFGLPYLKQRRTGEQQDAGAHNCLVAPKTAGKEHTNGGDQ